VKPRSQQVEKIGRKIGRRSSSLITHRTAKVAFGGRNDAKVSRTIRHRSRLECTNRQCGVLWTRFIVDLLENRTGGVANISQFSGEHSFTIKSKSATVPNFRGSCCIYVPARYLTPAAGSHVTQVVKQLKTRPRPGADNVVSH